MIVGIFVELVLVAIGVLVLNLIRDGVNETDSVGNGFGVLLSVGTPGGFCG
jgi:hypothetical protein